ncbi:hypothetical protein DH2020_041111 [Rehmannia glutinosa]|uniref:Uncharacterized protein n=1 Tax=Rehmannia glutinosa TaxID=99300 RepID=A0ABR0UT79_REHGL
MDLTKMFLFLLTLLSIYHAKFGVFNPIQILRPGSGAAGEYSDCLSWRLAVETNNLRDWRTVPESCAEYVADYMLGKQYSDDCDLVADAASDYAQSVKPTAGGDGKDGTATQWHKVLPMDGARRRRRFGGAASTTRGEADRGISGSMFKSKIRTELVNEGFRIVGNIGDQYGDILGDNIGNRTFKVPNPMYYIG